MNPSAPSIEGLIKLHKPDQPFCPVVNWKNAPAYKVSKLFTEKIHRLTPLPIAFNIKNTQELIKKLKDIPLIPCHYLASLDVTNMYSNIPIGETKKILTDILKRELVNLQAKQEIIKWYDIITRQNYFTHNNDIVTQYDRVAMGAPSSGLSRNVPTTHGTQVPSTLDTRAQNYKLLQIRR